MVHRDIKPENILLKDNTEDNAPILCDFGFTQTLKQGQLCTKMCGTKGYMAPEVLDKQFYSYPADVWSFGVMLYTLATGTLPFHVPSGPLTDKNTRVAWKLIMNTDLNFEEERSQHISIPLQGLLLGMLEKDPKFRLRIKDVMNHPWMASEDLSLLMPLRRATNESLLMPVRRVTNNSSKRSTHSLGTL